MLVDTAFQRGLPLLCTQSSRVMGSGHGFWAAAQQGPAKARIRHPLICCLITSARVKYQVDTILLSSIINSAQCCPLAGWPWCLSSPVTVPAPRFQALQHTFFLALL